MILTTAQIGLIRDSFHRLQPDIETDYDHLACEMVQLAG